MPLYEMFPNERIYNMLGRVYGVFNDDVYEHVVFNNRDTWNGQGVASITTVLDYNLNIGSSIYTENEDENIAALKNTLDDNSRLTVAGIPRLNVSPQTGNIINETSAAAYDVTHKSDGLSWYALVASGIWHKNR